MTSKKLFKCSDCAAEFARKDHATRHKLSHSRPKFVCLYPDCGLFFHRRDVLRRHEAVHKPENAEKRRRPRRGPLPPSRPGLEGQKRQSLSSEYYEDWREPVISHELLEGNINADTAGDQTDEINGGDWTDMSDDSVDSTCACHVREGTVCDYCSSELVRLAAGRISSESQGAIKFCMTHFVQSQLKWFPFIRPSSLRANWLISGRALILAALGARAIKEYKDLSGALWAEAVGRQATWASSTELDPNNLLSDFQTRILLLEYLQWSEDDGYPDWVSPMLNDMTRWEANSLMDMLSDTPSDCRTKWSVEDELCHQEIRWTLWKFYCTVTRSTLLGLKLHPPRFFQTLKLPGDPKKVLELEGCVETESKISEPILQRENRDCTLTLPQALSMLLGDQHSRIALTNMLSMTGKYILLHTVLYLSDNMVEKYVDIGTKRQDPLGWHVETRERLYLLVTRWRQCFWIPPEILWTASFPEFGIHQTIMLAIYLSVRISQPTSDSTLKDRCSLRPYAQYAMRCVVTMHIDMKNSNLMEVAAKGRWFLDGTTWRTGGLTAAYLLDWLRGRAESACEDEDIEYIQGLESVMTLYSSTGCYEGLSYSPARVAQLERSVKHLWTMVLGTESWLGGDAP
ncbi:hypothetical protein F5B22DRAFT_659863 [Xylaria bambusicola]|uniref:uncharacterized protein n=1 Tax=Xylaria bambusicola TaxID=326684 RepID=UPI002007883D|nr:uncharacterized protein F5B22DRAFT_659863 [Xylaria bambusicola]KAI0506970.1 hypothetical protein F5B22DRAFT_659863 [Xylaria bambusicola]